MDGVIVKSIPIQNSVIPSQPTLSEQIAEKRGRGRPIGSKNKAAKFKNYKPQKWKPIFTEIVVLSASTTMTNTELAERYQLSAGHISNILCTEQADEIRSGMRNKLNEISQGGIAERLARLQDKAITRVEEFMDMDHVFQKAPMEAVDRALKIMSGSKLLTADPQGNINNTTVINQQILNISPEVQKRLEVGLLKGLEIPIYDPSTPIDSRSISVEPK